MRLHVIIIILIPVIFLCITVQSPACDDGTTVATAEEEPATDFPGREIARKEKDKPEPGGPGPDSQGCTITWYPSGNTEDRKTDFSFVRHELKAGVPVWHGGSDMVMLNADILNTKFDTDAILPDSGRQFPDELWQMNLGLNYSHKSDNNRKCMLMLAVGSAADKPFESMDSVNLSIMGLVEIPAGNERDQWRFGIMYAPFSDMNFPMPGISYGWNPSENFRASIGLPLTIMWKPVKPVTINFAYFPVENIDARATCSLSEKLSVYSGFEIKRETYYLSDTENKNYRFLSSEKRLLCGISREILPHILLDLAGGYAFDRYYGEGKEMFRDLHDRVDIEPEFFLSAGCLFRF